MDDGFEDSFEELSDEDLLEKDLTGEITAQENTKKR